MAAKNGNLLNKGHLKCLKSFSSSIRVAGASIIAARKHKMHRFALVFACVFICSSWAVADPVLIWPLPAQYSEPTANLTLNSGFTFQGSFPTSTLSNAIARYTTLMFQHGAPSSSSPSGVSALVITVSGFHSSIPLRSSRSHSSLCALNRSSPRTKRFRWGLMSRIVCKSNLVHPH